MSIVRGIDIKLNVKPVFNDFTHEYAYEGPCRFAAGERLEPEFDQMLNNEIYNAFLKTVRENVPECVHLMDPVRTSGYTDSWNIREEDMERILISDETDAYLLSGSGRDTQMALEIAKRAGKPIFYYSDIIFALNTTYAAFYARNLEIYPIYDWEKTAGYFKALQVKKALMKTRALVVSRFTTDYSPVSSQDGFLSLEQVTDKLGVKFNIMNLHEYLDQFTIRPCDENPTLPGRRGLNLTEEELKEADAIADELMESAAECDMTRENLLPSVRAYYLTRKIMSDRDCNAFTAPCPDMCSTRRLNEEKCTLCLTHSLNEENGIPSACETDFSALVCKIILENLTRQATYMGNTAKLILKNGRPVASDLAGVPDEELEPVKDLPDLALTLHSVANRKLKGYDAAEEDYAIRSFAYSGWGATMRYDFSKDMGNDVTVIRIDPRCEKMLIIHGILKGQLGYKRQNCSTAMIYQVNDADEMFEKTMLFGSHMVAVYGDYRKELEAVCQVLGLEPVLV